MTKSEIQALIDVGYCRTSRSHCLISRIDRADWRQKVKNLSGLGPGGAEDFYRRVHSKDTLRVSTSDIRHFPGSCWNPVGFIPKPEIKTKNPRGVKHANPQPHNIRQAIAIANPEQEAERKRLLANHVEPAYGPFGNDRPILPMGTDQTDVV